ncbi:hypothetical protein FB45DRAFT_931270 [Roridomyces roridus]|uniref:Uncharacterized protein n=1 Tax=Roridomyces roridus TaxID=1738132 RepID=A0AAD7FER0_9AGAR|nr:hypothetical protein FB45DRAFT_931270 [Roridomyces roridus]
MRGRQTVTVADSQAHAKDRRLAELYSLVLHAEALLMECLKLMRQVERFSLRDFRPLRIGSCLPSLHFLNLWSCTLAFHAESWESHVANFLTRHPTITHLGLKMWTANGRGPLQLPQGTLLPRLQYYHGPLHLLCGFSKHSLRAIRTSWNGGDPSSFIENLRAQTGPDLGSLSLCNLAAAKVSDVLVHLSKHMSHLEKLELHFWDAPTNTAAIVNNINAYLTRSKRLAYLAMAFSTPDESDDAVVNSGNERRAFEMWTKTSPSLRGCCIGQTAWRKVGQKWEDCSKKVFLSEVGFAVFDQRANVDNH